MDISIFITVALVSVVLAYAWEVCFRIYPAYRKAQIAEALHTLAACIKTLNQDALINGRIQHREYLHDKFYKFALIVLINKVNLKFKAASKFKRTDESEKERLRFAAEIENLEPQTKQIVENAKFAIAKIFALRNPFLFIYICICVCFEAHQEKKDIVARTKREQIRANMIRSTEVITVQGDEKDLSYSPC